MPKSQSSFAVLLQSTYRTGNGNKSESLLVLTGFLRWFMFGFPNLQLSYFTYIPFIPGRVTLGLKSPPSSVQGSPTTFSNPLRVPCRYHPQLILVH